MEDNNQQTQHRKSIDFVTISTTGDAQDFGDIKLSHELLLNLGASNSIRGLSFAGGESPGIVIRVM